MDTEYSTEFEEPRTIKEHLKRQLSKKEQLDPIKNRYNFAKECILEQSQYVSDDNFTSVSMRPTNLENTSLPANEIPVPKTKMIKDIRFWQGQPSADRNNKGNITRNVDDVFKNPNDPHIIKNWFPFISQEGKLCIRGAGASKSVVNCDIKERYSSKRFSDSKGKIYILSGPINFHDRLPGYIYQNFATGIPRYWQKITIAWINYFKSGSPSNYKWPNLIDEESEDDTNFESYIVSKIRTVTPEVNSREKIPVKQPQVTEERYVRKEIHNRNDRKVPQNVSNYIDNYESNSDVSYIENSKIITPISKLQTRAIINSPQNYTMDFGRPSAFHGVNSTPLQSMYPDNSKSSFDISESSSKRSKSNNSLSSSVIQRKIAKLQAMLVVAKQRETQIDESLVSELQTIASNKSKESFSKHRKKDCYEQEKINLEGKNNPNNQNLDFSGKIDGYNTKKPLNSQQRDTYEVKKSTNLAIPNKNNIPPTNYDLKEQRHTYEVKKDSKLYSSGRNNLYEATSSNFDLKKRGRTYEVENDSKNIPPSNFDLGTLRYDYKVENGSNFIVPDKKIIPRATNYDLQKQKNMYKDSNIVYSSKKNIPSSNYDLKVQKHVYEDETDSNFDLRECKITSESEKFTNCNKLHEPTKNFGKIPINQPVFKKPNFVPTYKIVRTNKPMDEMSFIVETKNVSAIKTNSKPLTFQSRSLTTTEDFQDMNHSKRKRIVSYDSPVSNAPKRQPIVLVSTKIGVTDTETDFGSDIILKSSGEERLKNVLGTKKNQKYNSDTDYLSESFGDSPKKLQTQKHSKFSDMEDSFLESCDERVINNPVKTVDVNKKKLENNFDTDDDLFESNQKISKSKSKMEQNIPKVVLQALELKKINHKLYRTSICEETNDIIKTKHNRTDQKQLSFNKKKNVVVNSDLVDTKLNYKIHDEVQNSSKKISDIEKKQYNSKINTMNEQKQNKLIKRLEINLPEYSANINYESNIRQRNPPKNKIDHERKYINKNYFSDDSSENKSSSQKNKSDDENTSDSEIIDNNQRDEMIANLDKILKVIAPKKIKTPKNIPVKKLKVSNSHADENIFDNESFGNVNSNVKNNKTVSKNETFNLKEKYERNKKIDTIVEEVNTDYFEKDDEESIISNVSSILSNSVHLINWKPEIQRQRFSKWKLKIIGDQVNSDDEIIHENYKTGEIIERITNNTIQSVENERYVLMDELHDPDNKITDEIKDVLQCGFPPFWDERIDSILKKPKKTPAKVNKETKKTAINSNTFAINSVNETQNIDNASMNSTSSSRYGRSLRPPVKYWQGERILCIGNETFYQPPINVQESNTSVYSFVQKNKEPNKIIKEKKLSIKAEIKKLPVKEDTIIVKQSTNTLPNKNIVTDNSESQNRQNKRYNTRQKTNKNLNTEVQSDTVRNLRNKKVSTNKTQKKVSLNNSDEVLLEITKLASVRKRREKLLDVENLIPMKIQKKNAEPEPQVKKKKKTDRVVSSKFSKRKRFRYKKIPKVEKYIKQNESDDSGFVRTPIFENNKKCIVLLERLQSLLKNTDRIIETKDNSSDDKSEVMKKTPQKLKSIVKPKKKKMKKKIDAAEFQNMIKVKRKKFNANKFFASQTIDTPLSKTLGLESRIIPNELGVDTTITVPKKRRLYNENDWLEELSHFNN